ncbi:MAG: zinc ribbon domain-containing protein [Candidatus Aureabacteria bacterium]|nr:zinc ribbon domain-containing protein [Candidatus Auribacterota bacterium]
MNTCPKCQKPVQEKDVICLQCGARLKKLDQKFTVTSKEKKSSSPRPPSLPPNPVWNLLSFLFLCFTIFFAYAYVFHFSLMFKITDFMLTRGYLSLCDHTYALYQKIALSKDQNLIPLKYRQLKLERYLSAKKEFIPSPIPLKILETYQDDLRVTHLKVFLDNHSTGSLIVRNEYFYLKSSNHIYPSLPASADENIGPVKARAWEKITGGVSFKGLPALEYGKGVFSGKIIFNDGVHYAISPVNLISYRTEPVTLENWALIKKEEADGRD